MTNGIKKNGMLKRWPEIAVLLVCLVVLSVGIGGKEGYHMDELLSFELANARFTPWIVPTQPEGRLEKFVKNEIDGESLGETIGNIVDTVEDVISNRENSTLLSYTADVYEEPVWITAEQFEDYITVDDRDDFNYLSVYFNVKDDNHPPLHFMLVHTMSSLFQENIYPVMGCVINVAAVLGVMILLMRLGESLWPKPWTEGGWICGGRFAGLAAAALYGLSAGAMASTLLIRMYAMVTFFCVAFCYLHVRKWQENGFEQKNKLLILVTVLGFLTQYFFLFYCLFLALVTAICLLAAKKYKALFCYIRTMVISAVIGVGLYPFSISDVFSSGRGVEALNNLSEGLAGYGQRLAAFWQIVSDRTFDILLLPLLFIVVVLWIVIWCRKVSRTNIPLCCMLVLPVVGYFLLVARMAPYQVDRYMMPAFPFVVFLLVFALLKGVDVMAQVKKRIVSMLLVCGLFLWQAVRICGYDGSYQYEGYDTQLALSEQYADVPCICVYAGVGYYENLVEFTSYEKTLLLKTEELRNRQDTQSITELPEVVVLVKYGAQMDEVQDIMEENYGFTMSKALLSDSVHGDKIALFARKDG